MIRKARITDVNQIQSLITFWAKKGRVLPRSLNYIYENIRNFWVEVRKKKVVGCCALGVVGWQGLGEIKSLVVAGNFQGQGMGKRLVKRCLEEAQDLGIKNVFALTFIPQFFKKIGFNEVEKQKLPHKIWSDCLNCIYFPDCREEAVIINIA